MRHLHFRVSAKNLRAFRSNERTGFCAPAGDRRKQMRTMLDLYGVVSGHDHRGGKKEDGIMIFDSDMIKSFPDRIKRVFAIPATSLARDRIQNRIVTNMIMLGALCSVTGVVDRKALESAIGASVPDSKVEMNTEAFKLGFDNVKRFEI